MSGLPANLRTVAASAIAIGEARALYLAVYVLGENVQRMVVWLYRIAQVIISAIHRYLLIRVLNKRNNHR